MVFILTIQARPTFEKILDALKNKKGLTVIIVV